MIVAVLDANVLFSAILRDAFVRFAIEGVFEAHWTNKIHEEWTRAVMKQRGHVASANIERTRRLMDSYVPGGLVADYESLIETLKLPDANDRHVLAAAIRCRATRIITFNARDFPASALEPHGISTQTPDELLGELLKLQRGAVLKVLAEQRVQLQSPPVSIDEFLANLRKQKLSRFVDELEPLKQVL